MIRNLKIIPPFYFIISILFMLVLDRVAPLYSFKSFTALIIGGVLALLGFALLIRSSSLFRKAGTAINPFEESTELVTSGPFRFSRNPMYLAMIVMLLGVCLMLGSLGPVFALLLFVAIIRELFIKVEERKLHATFGAAYDDYCWKVRRWI